MNTKYNAGLAPIAIIIIIAIIGAVGGGTYYVVTKNKVSVAGTAPTPNTSVSVEPTTSAQPATATPKPSISKSPVTSPSKAPTGSVAVRFDTIQQAVSSGKNVKCIGEWWSEKGPDQYRNRYFINGTTVKLDDDTNSEGVITTSSTTYTPGHAQYNSVMTYKLSETTCTQQ